MIDQQQRRLHTHDDLEFQRLLLEGIGELLPAELLAACGLSHARAVLEIGSGAGEWLRALARHYPDLQCIGIDEEDLDVRLLLSSRRCGVLDGSGTTDRHESNLRAAICVAM